MVQLAVIVLAAGEGVRMRSEVPKVLHEIAGLPLIGHVLSTATAIAADHVVTVVRHEKERISAYLAEHFPNTLIAEQGAIAGTGAAVEAGLSVLPESFQGDVLVLSGDVPLLDVASISELIELHRSASNSGTLVSTILSNPNGYGRILRSRESLMGIIEQKDASSDQLEITEVNAGVYVFASEHLVPALEKLTTANAQNEKYLTDVATIMLSEGQSVVAHPINDHWLVAGINDRAQLTAVAGELNRRIVNAWQLAGVSVQEPASTWIDVTCQLGQDVTLLPSTRLKGLTAVGAGATIGPDTTLTDTTVGAGATVLRSEVQSSHIQDGATVGPFAFLRPGTDLGQNAKIGAFVETKNAKIGPGAKVPHLSYVGDAVIGEGANIGAGTIFANYDGVNKHQSTVGAFARTGSANTFVAPVSIGAGAYTAAGSTIRRNVEPGALALNPAAQKNLAGWVLENRPGSASAKAANQDTE
jgi:bifunctional UDP-N-acetylglucosamine pyrophosphorylase/glucosamine-1-phosphate N-acetyltransferase